MFSSGIGSLSTAIQTAMAAADRQMTGAADSIATGDLDNLVDASMQMTAAKMSMGIAGKLASIQDQMMQSTLSILA